MNRGKQRGLVVLLALLLLALGVFRGPDLVHFVRWRTLEIDAPPETGEWHVEQNRFSSRLAVTHDGAWVSTSSKGEPDHLAIFADGWAIRLLADEVSFHRAPGGVMPDLDPPPASVSRISAPPR